MPSATLGWTRDEIVTKVLDTMARPSDATLQARLQEDINFAQVRFWKMTDWRFAYKNGVADTFRILMATGTSTYTLNTANCGYEARVTDLERAYFITTSFGKPLFKTDLRQIRLWDPARQSSGVPEYYAASAHNSIEIWPIPSSTVNGEYLYFDGKVLPSFISTSGAYPTIPVEYQETFIQYLLVRAYSREGDPRQTTELQVFKDMLAADVRHDSKEVESNLRMKTAEEELQIANLWDGRTILWNS